MYLIQVAQISQRGRAAGWVSYGQKWKTGTMGYNIYGQYVYLQPLWRIWPAKQSNSVKKNTKYGILRRLRSSKVIEVSTNRKPVCDFLLVINSNYHPISYRFGDIAAYCWNFRHFAFLSHPLGVLGTTYDVHLWVTGNRVVDFLLVIIELFSLGVTAEALRAKIDRTSAISLQRGNPKFQVEGDVPTNNFCMDS